MKLGNGLDPEEFFETNDDLSPRVDDIYGSQKNYFKTTQGKKALRKAQ